MKVEVVYIDGKEETYDAKQTSLKDYAYVIIDDQENYILIPFNHVRLIKEYNINS